MAEAHPARRWRRPLILLAVLVVLAAIAGASLGTFLRLDLPDIRALEDYTPPVMTRVDAADGSPLATFAEQRRTLVTYNQIPQEFLRALVATEDAAFYRHTGVDFRGMLRAAVKDVLTLRLAQGGSTLTQQLARGLFLHPRKLWRRKLQEMVLAMEIERYYTKEEILTFYCNQVYMGHGQYGLAAAARFYFDKRPEELDLPESALLAGLVQRPESLSPLKHPEAALRRRNHVLDRMVVQGYLTREEAKAARSVPIRLAARRRRTNTAPYFVEDVRRWLKSAYGDASLYQAGLHVVTTLDQQLQEIANEAVDAGLRELDKRQGWRGPEGHVPKGSDPAEWEPASWKDGVVPGQVADGVVLAVARGRAEVRVGPYRGTLDRKDVAWTRRKDPARFLHPGDVIRVRVLSPSEGGKADLQLEQRPVAEAALVAIEPSTGEVRALVGGFDYRRSEFNRATQARRQTGSAFKPFVYAAALASKRTLADRILDEPTVFLDTTTMVPYQPENFGNKYYGTVTLRTALEKSANIATVKLLESIGYDPVIRLAHRLGITTDLRPYPSLALGSFEISLMELTAAYGTFANQGVWIEPHLLREVRDREARLLYRADPGVRDAVNPRVAYLMNRLLEGVISDGTGRAARSLPFHLAGKTGTTDDFTDAWFVGYSPDLALGVWVGFDTKKSLGNRETGARAALPIWKRFMEKALQKIGDREFPRPPGIRTVVVDRATGLRFNPRAGCVHPLPEVFVEGTEPTASCSSEFHRWLRLPYALQRYPLDDSGALRVPEVELQAILSSDPSLMLTEGGRRIVAFTPAGPVSLDLKTIPGGTPPGLPPELAGELDTSEWVGKDGRPARILLLKRR